MSPTLVALGFRKALERGGIRSLFNDTDLFGQFTGGAYVLRDKFIKDNPGLRISLLHLDVDLYEPTKAALAALYPLVVRGGLVVFDEYALPPWEGETVAADEFLATLPGSPTLRKFPFSSQPS